MRVGIWFLYVIDRNIQGFRCLTGCNLQHLFMYLTLLKGEVFFLVFLTETTVTKTMWEYGAKQINNACLSLHVNAVVGITHYRVGALLQHPNWIWIMYTSTKIQGNVISDPVKQEIKLQVVSLFLWFMPRKIVAFPRISVVLPLLPLSQEAEITVHNCKAPLWCDCVSVCHCS